MLTCMSEACLRQCTWRPGTRDFCYICIKIKHLILSTESSSMDLAKQAFGCNNYELATEIFDHLLQTHGPNMDWLIGRGNSLARRGCMNEALGDYTHAFRLGEVTPDHLNELVNALVASVSKKGGLTSIQKCRSKLNEQPTDLFTCPICQGLIYEPTTLPCGHTLCRGCLHNSQEPRTCAKCKVNHPQTVGSQMPRVNIVVGGVIEKYFPDETNMRRLRLEGNKLCAHGKNEDAIEKYTEAIKLGKWN